MLTELGFVQIQIYKKHGYGFLAGTDSSHTGKAQVKVSYTTKVCEGGSRRVGLRKRLLDPGIVGEPDFQKSSMLGPLMKHSDVSERHQEGRAVTHT